MKLFISLLFVFSTLSLKAQSNIDVLHYKFAIELNDSSDKIVGNASITLKILKETKEIEFDLTTLKKEGKGMVCTKVSAGLHALKGTNNNDKYTINLEQALHENDTITFNLNYSGIPSDGLIISKTKFGKRSFFADNWPNRGHNWLPCNDDPADKATVEFIVTAPQHYQVVSNGIQIEETNLSDNKKRTHWKEDVPISTKVMVIGVADFAVSLSGTIDNCIPVYSWVYPENIEKGFYDYAQAAEILPWFIKNIGPYAYKKLANVQSKTTFGGLENANTIFYSESSVNGNRRSESLLAHEIAHQWFGNYATEKSFAHLWLSEGFATYMTIMYLENKYGKDTAIAMLKEDRQQAINFGKSNPLPVVNNTKDYMALLNANSYQKGGWVLHMLRRQLGDSVFIKSIQTYYSMYGGKTADSKDLQNVFEAVAGINLEQFFIQWLYVNENLSLKIEWKYDASIKQVAVTITQLQKTLFEFPLTVMAVTKNSKRVTGKIHINKKTVSLNIPLDESPQNILADPYVELLAELLIQERK